MVLEAAAGGNLVGCTTTKESNQELIGPHKARRTIVCSEVQEKNSKCICRLAFYQRPLLFPKRATSTQAQPRPQPKQGQTQAESAQD